MTRRDLIGGAAALLQTAGPALTQAAQSSTSSNQDLRNITTGRPIPKEGYVDQPYVVITNDGNWLCVLTTGSGVEGKPGQHIVATISSDQGRSWSSLIDIEPADGPEASWGMPLKTPYGRVYVFYTYNKDNLREVAGCNSPGIAKRVDTLGYYYAYKYSDDHGRTWSKDRYYIPMRLMRIDRENLYAGKVLFFWGVGKPVVDRGRAYFGFAKVGKWGNPGTMVQSQGCFMRSDNVLTERDPDKIKWVLLPDGDEGLRAPKGQISDEANPVALSDGSLYATYRTIDGYNCHAYSRDGGHTWTPPAYATYSPEGRRIKHSRAANFVKKFSNGKFLLWFHNHGGEAIHAGKWEPYADRNPAWIAGGIEKNGHIHWSEPEILLYDLDPVTRISYPDFIEENGKFYVTETQKTVARVHEIDRSLLEGAWNQHDNRTVARGGVVLEAPFDMPRLPRLTSGGFAIDFRIRFRELSPGQVVLDTRDSSGKGIALTITDRSTMNLVLDDGRVKSEWDSDSGTGPGTLKVGEWQHVAVIVDGGPKIVTWVVDGVLNDGGAVREFGWGRFNPKLDDVNGSPTAKLAPALFGELRKMRIYDRYLRTSEVIGNYHAL